MASEGGRVCSHRGQGAGAPQACAGCRLHSTYKYVAAWRDGTNQVITSITGISESIVITKSPAFPRSPLTLAPTLPPSILLTHTDTDTHSPRSAARARAEAGRGSEGGHLTA